MAKMNRLQRILDFEKRQDKEEQATRKELGQEIPLIDKIGKRRLTWFGHVTGMEGYRLLEVALYGQEVGTRSRGRQPKWMDNVKEDLKAQE